MSTRRFQDSSWEGTFLGWLLGQKRRIQEPNKQERRGQ